MNDDQPAAPDQLITTIREHLADYQMTTPEHQVISRGRTARGRRRTASALATIALAATAIAAIAATTHSPHPARQPGIALAAWTVTTHANGTITVTIRELRDRAGLQRRLRAEGIPINLRFWGQRNPPCRYYTLRGGGGVNPGAGIIGYGDLQPHSPVVLTIHPAAIPAQAGISVFVASPALYAQYSNWVIGTALVHASPRCTGS